MKPFPSRTGTAPSPPVLPLPLLLLLLAWPALPAHSQESLPGESMVHEVTRPVPLDRKRILPETTWTSPTLQLTERGLAAPATNPGEPSHAFHLSTPPIAVGLTWRPLEAMNVWISVGGEGPTSPGLTCSIRYSIDRVHWSGWYPVNATSGAVGEALRSFQCRLQIRPESRVDYLKNMQVWLRTNPRWTSDEGAYCLWLAGRVPDFFKTHIPAIGYYQVRIDGRTLEEPLLLRLILLRSQGALGNTYYKPRDGSLPDLERPWNLSLKPDKPNP